MNRSQIVFLGAFFRKAGRVATLCLTLSLMCGMLFAERAEAAPGKKHTVKKTVVKGATNQPLADFDLGKYQYCGADRDCVTAINGCCDCANGGKDVALNKDQVSAFKARFDCLNTNCGEKEGDPACGSGVVSCISHKCRYIVDAPPPKKPKPKPKPKKSDDDE